MMKPLKVAIRYLVATLPLLFSAIVITEPVYKSVDAEGNISYGDAPAADAVVVETMHLDSGSETDRQDPADISAELVEDLQAATARLKEARLARESSRQSQTSADFDYYPAPEAETSARYEDDGPYYPYYPPYADVYRPFRYGRYPDFRPRGHGGYHGQRERGDGKTHRHGYGQGPRKHGPDSTAGGFATPFRERKENPSRLRFEADQYAEDETWQKPEKNIRIPLRD